MSMSPKTLPAIILIVASSLFAERIEAAEAPNVILIMTDDQGYGDLACHGNPVIRTPNLDCLHDQSMRLTNFHVSPFCTPTRAALMTGHYPERTGAYRLTLRQSPVEADKPVQAVRARVQIAGQEKESAVAPGSKGVAFELELPVGRTELRTWLYDQNGKAGGAYFTEVEAL